MHAKRYASIVNKHRPAGYMLRRRRMTALDGVARFERIICVSKELEGTDALFVFLHECGHVHMKHMIGDGKVSGPRWREEYEADQYAIQSMREGGIPVPRERLKHQKQIIRELIEPADGSEHIDDDILRYAYGKEWRKHR